MLDVKEERLQGCVVSPAEVEIDFSNSLRQAIVEYTSMRATEATQRYFGNRSALFNRTRKTEDPYGNIWVRTSGQPHLGANMQNFSFGIRLMSDDAVDINYVLLECHTETARRLYSLMEAQLPESPMGDDWRFYVMIMEPTLHNQESGGNHVLQFVACMPNHLGASELSLAREAARQLESVA